MIGNRIFKIAIPSVNGGRSGSGHALAAASVRIVVLACVADAAPAAQRTMSMMSGMRGASTGYTGGASTGYAGGGSTRAREIWARMAAWAIGSGSDWASASSPE